MRTSTDTSDGKAPAASATSVSVVVPTRGRPASVVACVQSILAIRGFVELIIVDQSDDRETEAALGNFDDPRLRYIRTPTRGVTNGRNIGIDASSGAIVAFTDDDCRVTTDWAERIAAVFARDPDVAVVCGRVCVPEEISRLGYAEGFEPRQREWRRRFPPLGRDWGITANMSIRRSALAVIGPFDPFLGSGAPLLSGGEPDFLFRALRAGYTVVNASEVVVDHFGLRRPGAETTTLIMRYGAGTASAIFKHARLGDPLGIWVYLKFLGSATRHFTANVVRGQRPTGFNYLKAFIGGTLATRHYRVDRQSRMFLER